MTRSTFITMIVQTLLLFSAVSLCAPNPHPRALGISKRASNYWVENIQRNGAVAYGNDNSYKVFRNVKDYGAKGDGTTDDTAAISRAVADGNRCGLGCDSSTTTPAIVYFPAGTYLISTPIEMHYYTQMIGDATAPPTIKGAASFQGLALLDANPYIPNGYGANWFTNQNNFFRQIRNFIIDLRDMPEAGAQGEAPTGIHWQVAQATSLQNIVFQMKPASPTNKQRGLMIENGSGGFMSDLIFNGGDIGAYIGSQQFTTRNFTFNNCNTAILLIWDWLWTFKSVTVTGCKVGLDISSLQNDFNQSVGSAILMDSKIQAVIGVSTSHSLTSHPATGGTLLIQNVDFTGSTNAIARPDGTPILSGGALVASWGQGHVYLPSQNIKRDGKHPTPHNLPQNRPDGFADVCSENSTLSQTPAAFSLASISSGVTNSFSSRPTTQTVQVSPIPAISSYVASNSVSYSPQTPSIPETLTRTSSAAASGTAVSSTFATGAPAITVKPSSTFVVTNGSTIATYSINPLSTVVSNGTSATTASLASTPFTCTAAPAAVSSSNVQGIVNAAPISSTLKDGSGRIFERSKPQYETISASLFVSVKSFGAKGDGVTDDTAAIQSAMNGVTADKILYFDHGAYLITQTVNVPKNIRITGEIWPLIMIGGAAFQDQTSPKPGFRVGAAGDTGAVEISDLIFETKGPAPGAIMMEWNVADSSQGSCGMWDVHFRVGGTAGTELQQDKCLAKTPDSKVFKPECAGSFLMMHVTQQATAYFENTWFWVADHELDMALHNQTNIYNGRGVLIESQGPVWLYGTASEHSQLYNYQLTNAKNIFMAAIQTETAYMQSAPNALNGGFTPNPAFSDPDFANCTGDSCKKTWGLRVVDSTDVYMYGGGLYSFFDDYDQTCLDTESCQLNMVDVQCSSGVYLYGLVTKASTNQVVVNGVPTVKQIDNNNLFGATVLLFEQQ